LLVPGRIGDDKGTPRRGEETVGDVDGDALLALGFQAVDQQCEVDVVALSADLLAVAFQGVELVVKICLLS